jgi:hypothetical protein
MQVHAAKWCPLRLDEGDAGARGGSLVSAPRERLVGIFEFRSHPISDPAHVRRRRCWADRGINGWYVVIDNGGGVDDAWQWGYGLTWLHPDPDVQPPVHGTFDQMLVSIDDAARTIVQFVKEQAGMIVQGPRGDL